MKQWATKNHKELPEHDPDDLGGVFDFGAYIFLVIAPDQPSWEVVDTAVHESVHVFQKAMTYVGETAGNETEAYMIASIATNILKDYHALHEKWQAGLQKRSRAVHQQAGSQKEASRAKRRSPGNGQSGESP